MRSFVAIALSLAFLCQEKAAEDVLKRLIEPIEKAKSMRIGLTWKAGDPAVGDTMDGSNTLLWKEGSKVHLTAKLRNKGREHEWTTICDGVKTWSSQEGQRKDAPLMPEGTQKAIGTIGFTQMGFLLMRFGMRADPKGPPNLGNLLEVSNVQSGPDEQGAGTLTYDVLVKEPGGGDTALDDYKIKVWYDRKSLKLLKRAVTSNDRSIPNTEEYRDLAIDVKIPDEKFKLPEEKK